MADFKFNFQEPNKELVMSIAALLDADGIPNVLWGNLAFVVYGVWTPLMETPAPYVHESVRSWPVGQAHFNIEQGDDPRYWITLDLHKKSHLLWAMPDFTLGPPPPNDPNYMSLSDSRLLEYNPASKIGHLPPAYIDVVKVPTVARFAEALALLYYRDGVIDELSCVGGSWFILQSYIQDHPLLDLDDLEPRIRRHYEIAQEEYGVKGRVRYSEKLVAEMMEANELPPRPPQFIDNHSCLFGLDVEK